MEIFGKANVSIVHQVLFSNMVFALEDVELTKYILIESVSALKISLEKERTVFQPRSVEPTKSGVMLQMVVSVQKVLLMLMINADNVLMDQSPLLMENLVSAAPMIKYSMIRTMFVRLDAQLTNFGEITNVDVFQDTVGGINNVKNVQTTLTQPLIKLLVPVVDLTLISILKHMFVLTVLMVSLSTKTRVLAIAQMVLL